MKTSSDKRVWNKIKKNLLANQNKELQIGFFREDNYGTENNNLPVALVAAWQDKGTPFVGPEHIPARPFMSEGLPEILKSSALLARYKKSFLSILKGKSVINEYNLIGELVVPALKQVIDNWKDPPNADFTIAQKGRDDPLVDSGKMRDSVKAKVGDS